MTDDIPAVHPRWSIPTEEYRVLVSTLRRARRLLGDLDTSRGTPELERVQHGAAHELEHALKLLGSPWEWAGVVTPGDRPMVDVELPLNPEEVVTIRVPDPPLFDT